MADPSILDKWQAYLETNLTGPFVISSMYPIHESRTARGQTETSELNWWTRRTRRHPMSAVFGHWYQIQTRKVMLRQRVSGVDY